MQHEELQNNWALVVAYRAAPKQEDGKLKNGEKQKLMTKYGKTKKQVSRIVMLVLRADNAGISLDLSDHRALNPGRPNELTPEIETAMKMINRKNLQKRINTTRRMMMVALDKLGYKLSLGTVHSYIDLAKGKITAWSVKPLLKQVHQDRRLGYIDQQVVPGQRVFRSVDNDVHVDEKWFFLIFEKGVLLLFGEDELPATYAQHKNRILKVMFLCAVGKPQLRPDGTRFNGLITCIPFTEVVPAKRNSVNRPKGTLEENPVSVTADVYRAALRQVLSLIRRRLWWKKGEKIMIRQDGAKPHTGGGNVEYFGAQGQMYGWNIVVDTQSAQSPDFNLLDIAVFRSMQSRSEEYRTESNSVSDLVARVKKTFETYPWQTLDICWAVLHEHYRLIRMEEGGNKICNPHSGIRRRVSKGLDPVNCSIDFDDGDSTDDEVDE
jgi:hypothetical protein